MIALIVAVTVGWNTIGAAVVSAALAAAATFGAVGKRAKDLAELYRGLYEGKAVEVSELEQRVARLEQQLGLYQSDFTKKIAEGVTEAILRLVSERLDNGNRTR